MNTPRTLAKIHLLLAILLVTGGFDGGECNEDDAPGTTPTPLTSDYKFPPEELQVLVDLDFRAHEDPAFDFTTMSISLRTESEAVAIVDSRFFYNDQQYPFEDFPGLLTAGAMMYEDVNLETHLVPIPGSTNPGIKDLPSSISTSVPLELSWNGPPIGEHDTVAVTVLDRGLRVATSETSDPGATSVTFLPDELAMIGSDSITIRVTRTTVTPFEGPGGGEITVTEYGFDQSVRVE